VIEGGAGLIVQGV